ncbi:hypothetical protein L3X38_033708 [Prunus dulcis]|uniref:Uncharacterized protein n=1 Tax=Prunus dulcis TaxID=3755 RepID=A0AAD4VGH1_PRUDU|nr:hypothetical protein L3X38_033708 [Prunus dulcis]
MPQASHAKLRIYLPMSNFTHLALYSSLDPSIAAGTKKPLQWGNSDDIRSRCGCGNNYGGGGGGHGKVMEEVVKVVVAAMVMVRS